MNEAAAYIKKQQPDIICFQEAPDNGYYHPDSIRQAFAYAPLPVYQPAHGPFARSDL